MSTLPQLAVAVRENSQLVEVCRENGTRLLAHRIFANQRPSIHPIYAPDGNGILTEDAPSHHPWQHGLYTGFNLVNGIGFWKEFAEDGTFHPELSEPPRAAGACAHWSLRNLWRAPNATDLITEQQDWTLIDEGSSFNLQVSWRLHALVDVEIGQYMAGGLFLRMPYAEATGGFAVNSEGLTNKDAEKQRARWVAISMPIDGREDWGGFALMDHPGNPAHPVTWRVDNELGVSPSRCIAESWSIPAGTSEHYTFKLHVFVGEVDSQDINARWKQFAEQ